MSDMRSAAIAHEVKRVRRNGLVQPPLGIPAPAQHRAFPSAQSLSTLAAEMIQGYVVEVTPDLARQWLNANWQNRNIRLTHVKTLMRDIMEGRWRVTHQGIAFSDKGRLIDGQHRLQAIVSANKSAFLTVFVGLDDDMFGALDRGARRSVSDEIDEDRRAVEPCNLLCSLLAPENFSIPAPAEVRTMVELYRPELHAMLAAAGGFRTAMRTSAPIKVALIVRLRQLPSDSPFRKLLLEQFEAFTRYNVKQFDTTTATMDKRLLTPTANTGRAMVIERLATAWVGFDPSRRDRERFGARNESAALVAEMTETARAQVEASTFRNNGQGGTKQ